VEQALGTIGHLGCLSFHETKSVAAGGEGGAILVNSPELAERTEILREKGTDRSRFWRGEVAKYTWQDIGSSYLLSDLQAAYLLAQLEAADEIDRRRHELWTGYENALRPLATAGRFELPTIPPSPPQSCAAWYAGQDWTRCGGTGLALTTGSPPCAAPPACSHLTRRARPRGREYQASHR
jgi:dTDP-4-amino-4,6-dideoxygalactose transaminase